MEITIQHFTFFGICFDIFGALLILSGVFVTKKKAIEVGVSRFTGETDEENLRLPSVSNLLAQSKIATIGTVLLAIGFILQAIAAWPF